MFLTLIYIKQYKLTVKDSSLVLNWIGRLNFVIPIVNQR